MGALSEARDRAPKQTVDFDLRGETLLPGFIEPHLYPPIAAIMLQNEIVAPYDWKLPSGIKPGVSGEEQYRARITQSSKANATAGEMYFIWGYHQLWHGSLLDDENDGGIRMTSKVITLAVLHQRMLNDTRFPSQELHSQMYDCLLKDTRYWNLEEFKAFGGSPCENGMFSSLF